MSKKHLKRLKELQRLQALHKNAASEESAPAPKQVLEPFGEEAPKPTEPAAMSAAPVAVDAHSTIKKDLVFLVILIVIMLLVLVALNWLVAATSFGDWIIKAAGYITS